MKYIVCSLIVFAGMLLFSAEENDALAKSVTEVLYFKKLFPFSRDKPDGKLTMRFCASLMVFLVNVADPDAKRLVSTKLLL